MYGSMPAPETPAFEDMQWLAGFARRLARDPDEADDLVQETLLTAWRHPPQPGGALRPWLATVFRNRQRMERRAQARRVARDAASAPPMVEDAAPEAAVALVRVLARLTAELEALAPEDQQLIVRRFLQGQSSAEIARAMSLPAATVRSRIRRLLAGLRERLDARCDGRDAWCAVVLSVPMAGPAGTITTSRPGVNAMLKPILLATLVATTTAGAYAGLRDTEAVAGAAASGVRIDAAATVATPNEPDPDVAQTEVAAKAEPTARARWQQTRAALKRSLRERPPTQPAPTTDTRQAYARLVLACVRDIDNRPATVSLVIEEVGDPELGTIVSEAKVVGDAGMDPEVLECAEQSMYTYRGPAPAVAFERTVRMGMKTAPKRSPEQLEIRLHFYMDSHFADVRACEPEGIEGHVDLEVTADEDGKVAKVDLVESSVDDETAACIVAAASSWKFPEAVATSPTRHRYRLPIHDIRIAE